MTRVGSLCCYKSTRGGRIKLTKAARVGFSDPGTGGEVEAPFDNEINIKNIQKHPQTTQKKKALLGNLHVS